MNVSDREVLKEYIEPQDFFKTTHDIETTKSLRPFDRKTPFLKGAILRIFSLLMMLVYIYISFIILQLALFNLIMMGVMFVYFKKLYFFFHSLEFRYDQNYRN